MHNHHHPFHDTVVAIAGVLVVYASFDFFGLHFRDFSTAWALVKASF